MLNLDDREWREFFITDICAIHSGVRLTKADMVPGNTPFVGSSESNNGITAFTGSTNASRKSNVLGVNYNGSVVESFYHPYEALFSDDVKQLEILHPAPTECMYLFLKASILKQKSKYAYGYKFNAERMRRQIILLPVNEDGDPDWEFMGAYIHERKQEIVARQTAFLERESQSLRGGEHADKTPSLEDRSWMDFPLVALFDKSQRGKRLKKANHTVGAVPYVSSTGIRNGVDGFIEKAEGCRAFESCISLNNSGSVGKAFYEPFEFVASDHVTHLKRDNATEEQYLFLTAAIEMQSSNFSFNREINDERLKSMRIMLPINEDGDPDWEFMGSYVAWHRRELTERLLRFLKPLGPLPQLPS